MKDIQNEQHVLLEALAQLKQDHRELDLEIQALAEKLTSNQLEVSRLKKKKLKLKDSIEHLESQLIPDLLA